MSKYLVIYLHIPELNAYETYENKTIFVHWNPDKWPLVFWRLAGKICIYLSVSTELSLVEFGKNDKCSQYSS